MKSISGAAWMTFPQLLSVIHLALASALGLFTLNELQLFVYLQQFQAQG